MKNIFISVLNFNGSKNTQECIDSLKKIVIKDLKVTIIVVDNGSSEKLSLKDNSWDNIKLKILTNSKNEGFSGGHNISIKEALKDNANYIILLNNDTYVDKNFLIEMIKAAEIDEKIGILAPKIYFAPNYEFHKNRYEKSELGRVFWYAGGVMDWKNIIAFHRGVDMVDVGQFDKVESTDFASGCCMMIRVDVLKKVGFFDNKYFLYYEDSDFNIRTKKAGFKILYIPKSIIFHKNAGSSGGSGSRLQDYYITRNRLIFGMKYAPIRAKIAILKESMKIIFTGRYWQRRGVLDFYFGRLGKGSYRI